MSSLKDKTILVTRPDPQGAALCHRIEQLGGRAIPFPTIAFGPPPDPAAFERALAVLGEQDWLLFVSPQAIYASVPAIRKQWPQFPPEVQFAAIGAGTAKALREAGINPAVYPTEETSSEIFLCLPEFQAIEGKKIAIVRGEGGREVLDKILAERGAKILPVIAYHRTLPRADATPVIKLLEQQLINGTVCTSYEGVKNLKILLGERGWPYIKKTPLIVMSGRIKILAHDLGFQTIWVPRQTNDEAILQVIEEKL